MSQPNPNKWVLYADGPILYGPPGSGQNLGDVQGFIADEVDASRDEMLGDAVASALTVTIGTGLSVDVAAGTAYIGGQRVVLQSPATVSGLPANTGGIKVLVSASAVYSTSVKGWVASLRATTGAPTSDEYLLATATTGPTTVTTVVDNRILALPVSTMVGSIDDTQTPAATAQSLWARLGQLANRIKDLTGEASWLTAPDINLAQVAASFLAAFDETTGHLHTGTTSDAPKLAQIDTHEGADTDDAAASLHHTLGAGATQAIKGTHAHSGSAEGPRLAQANTHESPDTDAGTGSLHHTLGAGANQAAAGNHVHSNLLTTMLEFVIDGADAVIETGLKGYLEVPFACTITAATLLADQSGSIVVDIFKSTYAAFDPPTTPGSGQKITASAPPTISAAKKSQNTTLTGWTTAITAGDILAFNVNSVTTIQRVTLSLKVTRT